MTADTCRWLLSGGVEASCRTRRSVADPAYGSYSKACIRSRDQYGRGVASTTLKNRIGMKATMEMRMVGAVMDGRRMMTMAVAEVIMRRRSRNSSSHVARVMDRLWVEKLVKIA